MSRLYFTDPIKAIYMMKEFGVELYADTKIGSIDFGDFEVDDGAISIQELFEITKLYPNKFYVAKESEAIFKPKEGDIGLNLSSDEIAIAIDEEDYETKYGSIDPARWYTIIMRDGKHFFTPENEII